MIIHTSANKITTTRQSNKINDANKPRVLSDDLSY